MYPLLFHPTHPVFDVYASTGDRRISTHSCVLTFPATYHLSSVSPPPNPLCPFPPTKCTPVNYPSSHLSHIFPSVNSTISSLLPHSPTHLALVIHLATHFLFSHPFTNLFPSGHAHPNSSSYLSLTYPFFSAIHSPIHLLPNTLPPNHLPTIHSLMYLLLTTHSPTHL